MRGFTKTQKAACEKEFAVVEAAILRAGGVLNPPNAWHQYTLPTIGGELGISLSVGEHLHSIFCRFTNVDIAKVALKKLPNSTAFVSLNPYSGKWNFHYSGDEVETMADRFLCALDEILIKEQSDAR